jgi:hypothetical protein
MVRKGILVQDVLDAAKNSGKELARTGKISKENQKIVSRELVPLDTYMKMTNRGFKQVLERISESKSSP